jgi:general secretion pathway protein D
MLVCDLLTIAAFIAFKAQDAPSPAPEPEPAEQASQRILPSGVPQGEPVARLGEIVQGDLVTRFYRIGHSDMSPGQLQQNPRGAFYENILNRLRTEETFVQWNEQLHLLVVRERREVADQLEQALMLLERPQPQIVLDGTLAEVQFERDFQWGFEGAGAGFVIFQNLEPRHFVQQIAANLAPQGPLAGTPFQGTSFRFGVSAADDRGFTLDGWLRSFVQRGRARILAKPRLAVGNGEQAVIESVQRVPIPEQLVINQNVTTTVKYQDVGVKVTIQPHTLGANRVEMEISVELSKVISFVTFTTGGTTSQVPVIGRRTSSTTLVVDSGTEVAISGIYREEELDIRRGLPILSDIPILGFLFGRTEESSLRSDLVFIVRPQVISAGESLPEVIRPNAGERGR